MHFAVIYSTGDVVGALLREGADVDVQMDNGATPLMIASETGKPGIVSVLLDAGADPNAKAKNGVTSLHMAARLPKSDVVDALLDAGADPNGAGASLVPLHFAASLLRASNVQSLLRAGGDPNARLDDGTTALHLVISRDGYFRWSRVLTALIDGGAEPNAATDDGITALGYLAWRIAYDDLQAPEKETDFVAQAASVLLEAGADPRKEMEGASKALVEAMTALMETANPRVVSGGGSDVFRDGTHIVGLDIRAGTYRNTGGEYCYWERLSGFSGEFDDIIANGTLDGVRGVVTIRATDKGFSSQDCGEWGVVAAIVERAVTVFGDGTHIVGMDIRAGTYRNTGGEYCYWERLSAFSGEFDDIIANGILEGVRGVVTIEDSDKGFGSQGCGKWEAVR